MCEKVLKLLLAAVFILAVCIIMLYADKINLPQFKKSKKTVEPSKELKIVDKDLMKAREAQFETEKQLDELVKYIKKSNGAIIQAWLVYNCAGKHTVSVLVKHGDHVVISKEYPYSKVKNNGILTDLITQVPFEIRKRVNL